MRRSAAVRAGHLLSTVVLLGLLAGTGVPPAAADDRITD